MNNPVTASRANFRLHGYDTSIPFVIDTGASCCIIKREVLPNYVKIDTNEQLPINGIGGGVYAIGTVTLIISLKRIKFSCRFHVVDGLKLLSTEGILGNDFLMKYGAYIDFESSTLSLGNTQGRVSTVLQNTSKMISIPSRSEFITFVSTNVEDDYVIFPREIAKDVFIASTIVRPKNGKIPVRILNIREEVVNIKQFTPLMKPLSEFNLLEKTEFESNPSEREKLLFENLNLEHLKGREKVSVEQICRKFSDLFLLPGDKLTYSNVFEQSIPLKSGVAPIYKKPYRIPHSQQQVVEEEIQKMLDNDIIEEASSPWSSPVLLVPKKADENGQKKWRLVVDYRAINDSLIDDKFPLPNITDILDSLSGAVYFTHLDLNQGYYQMLIDPKDRDCTSFSTNKGQYRMKRLPMGLKISPSAFSRLMTIAMAGLNYSQCFVYLDDLIVFGKHLEDHNKNLHDVFLRLREANLKLNAKKCEFLKTQMLYLGFVVSDQGISPDPAKIDVVKNFPKPMSVNECKRFVAFANYYRRHIRNFSQIASPLNKLTRKGVQFKWEEEQEKAFETLKQKLIGSEVLDFPNFTRCNIFEVTTDASKYGLGAVLHNGNGKPVAYASRMLNSAEQNYSTIEKELLGVVWAVRHFRPYLYGRKFKIFTDHRPLVYLFSMTDPSSRLTKFRLALEDYSFEVFYKKGTDNAAADALSRISSDELKQISKIHEDECLVTTRYQERQNLLKAGEINNEAPIERIDHPSIVELLKKPRDSLELEFRKNPKQGESRTKDCIGTEFCYYVPKINKIIFNCAKFVQKKSSSTDRKERLDIMFRRLSADLKSLCGRIKQTAVVIVLSDDNQISKLYVEYVKKHKIRDPKIIIIKRAQIIKNPEEKDKILNNFHIGKTAGHIGMQRMFKTIRQYYYWNGLKADVENFVNKCILCKKTKHHKTTRQPLEVTTTASQSMEKLYLDLVGPLPKDNHGKEYILTIQCELTKFIIAKPIEDKRTRTVAQAFMEAVILQFGVPKTIATDRGTEFMSQVMKDMAELLGIEKLSSTAYHHETIGALENSHKTLGNFLRVNSHGQYFTWSEWIPFWTFMYNTTVHSSHNYTPFELLFGRKCVVPSLIHTEVQPIYNFDDYAKELKYRLQMSYNDARQTLMQNKIRQCEESNKEVKKIVFQNSQKVFIKRCDVSKLEDINEGPFDVVQDLGPNILIKRNGKFETIHKNRTILFKD